MKFPVKALFSRHTVVKAMLTTALSVGLVGVMSTQNSWSDVVVDNLKKDPLTASLETELNVKETKAGDTFIAVTQEDYYYKTSFIPAGSRVVGEVEKVRKSKRFGRPGYIQLKIKRVEFPDGGTFNLPETYTKRDKQKARKGQRQYHPKARTKSGMVKSSLVSTIAGSSTTIALTSVGMFAAPYALGARVAAGAVWEGVTGDKEKPLYKRMARGGWEGTGVPKIYHFVKKEPNPVYEAGSQITLHMHPQIYEELLEANKNPNVDWHRADFKKVDWENQKSQEQYAQMVTQLNTDVPDVVLNVEAKPQNVDTVPTQLDPSPPSPQVENFQTRDVEGPETGPEPFEVKIYEGPAEKPQPQEPAAASPTEKDYEQQSYRPGDDVPVF